MPRVRLLCLVALTDIFGERHILSIHDTAKVVGYVIVFPKLKNHTPKGRENELKQNEKLNFLIQSHWHHSSPAR
jgi:hypothetical protein